MTMRASLPMTVALAAASLLAALSGVAWRQGRAQQVMEARETLRIELALQHETLGELEQQVRALQSRRRVIDDGTALGLRAPGDEEVIHLPGGA